MTDRAKIVLVVLGVLLLGGVATMGGISQAIIQQIATAIATAEGFFVAGSRPARNHNPGDLTKDLTGQGIGFDGAFVVYPNDQAGWDALYKQVSLMFGGSAIYNAGMTIAQVASFYTTTDQAAWAATVAQTLGVSPDTTLNQVAGA